MAHRDPLGLNHGTYEVLATSHPMIHLVSKAFTGTWICKHLSVCSCLISDTLPSILASFR